MVLNRCKGVIIKFYGSHLFFLSEAGSAGRKKFTPQTKLGFLRCGGLNKYSFRQTDDQYLPDTRADALIPISFI